MRFPSSWTLCVTQLTPNSPKLGKRVPLNYFLHFALLFVSSLQLAGNRRHFKFGVQIDHRKSQPTLSQTDPERGEVESSHPL